jgi:ATP-dependent Zn protease
VQIVVIGASNRPQDIDPAILRRLPVQLEVGLPDSRQRKQILEIVISLSLSFFIFMMNFVVFISFQLCVLSLFCSYFFPVQSDLSDA